MVPRKYDLDPKLGCWVETQRQLFNRDFKQLQEIETRALSDGDDNYQAAVAGYQGAFAEADASVDLDSKPSAAPDGVLMDTNTGILPTRRLTQERKDRLDELGFVWSLRHKRIADHWQKMFEQLKEYKDQHGGT